MYVHEGNAVLTFDNGEAADIQARDILTIEQAARATWSISKPVGNSYQYHNSFDSASQSADQGRR
jgi:uncharacterized cupin superfamily protein